LFYKNTQELFRKSRLSLLARQIARRSINLSHAFFSPERLSSGASSLDVQAPHDTTYRAMGPPALACLGQRPAPGLQLVQAQAPRPCGPAR